MVVPEEIRSTSKDDFESYMADAERQYRDVCRVSPTQILYPLLERKKYLRLLFE